MTTHARRPQAAHPAYTARQARIVRDWLACLAVFMTPVIVLATWFGLEAGRLALLQMVHYLLTTR